MIKVLIAGCGDLGLNIARVLSAQTNYEVWGLRRSVCPDFVVKAQAPSLKWLHADLTKASTLTNLPKDFTHIIYAAAADGRTEQQYRDIYIAGLKNVVLACKSTVLERVIFVSSSAVYGEHGDQWVDETTPIAPLDFNGRILVEAENYLLSAGLECVTLSLRLSGIYGPDRHFLLNRLRDGLASAPEHGSHWVNRVHIEDAAGAAVHLLTYPDPDPVYLITDSVPMQMRILYETLAKLVNGPTPKLGPAPKSVGSKRLSNSRLLNTGYPIKWPDSIAGHAALLGISDFQHI